LTLWSILCCLELSVSQKNVVIQKKQINLSGEIKMYYLKRHQLIIITLIFCVLAFFVVWAEMEPGSLIKNCKEDGILENLSAFFFGLSSICFVVFTVRSEFLKKKNNRWIYIIPILWSLLMFVFMGEEISWGQRIFNVATPVELAKINKQKEFNIHNIKIVDDFAGGKYRYLTIMILTTGLILPLFSLTDFGKRTIQLFAYPVPPLCYSILFLGLYVYGKYYNYFLGTYADEVREFLFSIGMLCFALHGAISPSSLFRTHNNQ
jgi:hypothetical protein